MFESESNPISDPIIFYFAGGPGCSSILTLLFENGPYQLDNQKIRLMKNDNRWSKISNIVYVDQPPGTGFSYSDSFFNYARDNENVADYMYSFLIKFFQKYPQFSLSPVFIMGDSFAGQFIPTICAKILQKNEEKNPKPEMIININGAAIGGGWTSPLIQYGSLADYAFQKGLISIFSREALDLYWYSCKGMIASGVWELAVTECNMILNAILSETGVCSNDIRKNCTWNEDSELDYSRVFEFLEQRGVRRDLNVGSHTWSSCSEVVKTYMSTESLNDVTDKVEGKKNNILFSFHYLD